ncbi:MAG: hypothetical protein QOE05_1015 [Actinomycetota bacterium]|jgi:hypothetical protein|nr:hypothetical protein [Actinomycetota bacterium]
MTGAVAQVRALAWLRWQMVRSPGARLALCAAPLLLIWFVQIVVASAATLTQPALVAATELAPAAFLGFAVLAVIAPLTAGGGIEIVPSSQLVAYPVRPRTWFLGGLLLAPANLVWVVQLLVLAAETSYLTIEGNRLAGGLTTCAYVVCLTIVGQAIAWGVVGLRQTRSGRRLVGTLLVAALVVIAVIVRGGFGHDALDASPTHSVVTAIEAGPGVRWLITTFGLVAASVIGLVLGAQACGWATSRPSDATTTGTSVAVRRRAARRSAYAELVAVDRASVWRASALRRGGLVLAVLPGVAAIGAAVPWQSLVVLPGLVSAGAGLLFGINAFSLDGSGAVWLASLPHDPRLLARAKLRVLVETVAASIVVVLVAGSLRSPGTPTPAQLTAIFASAFACGAVVVATCMALSVRQPHRADLNGPRDAVAPPGALTLASARLALPAGLIGFAIEGSSHADMWWVPLAAAAPIVALALLSLQRSLARYADPRVRARIVQTVSAG